MQCVDCDKFWSSFLCGYRSVLDAAGVLGELWSASEVNRANLHWGSEVLVRSVGRFQGGYVYEGKGRDHPHVSQAIEAVQQHFLDPDIDTFGVLRDAASSKLL